MTEHTWGLLALAPVVVVVIRCVVPVMWMVCVDMHAGRVKWKGNAK